MVSSNLQLAQKAGSRIDLTHLRVLSVDVLSSVNQAIDDKVLEETYWRSWLRHTVSTSCDRAWYETNLSMLVNCRLVSLDTKLEQLDIDVNGYL